MPSAELLDSPENRKGTRQLTHPVNGYGWGFVAQTPVFYLRVRKLQPIVAAESDRKPSEHLAPLMRPGTLEGPSTPSQPGRSAGGDYPGASSYECQAAT